MNVLLSKCPKGNMKGGVKMDVNEFKAELARHGYSICSFSKKIGIPKKRMYSHLSRGAFTQAEIKLIADELSLSNEKIMKIFFDCKVS